MNLTRSVAKNVFLQYLSRVIGTIFGLVTLAILTRYLGDEGYGQFTVAAAYLQFVGTLADFGLTITTIQMLSEPNADRGRILGNLLGLRIVMAVAIFALSIVVALFLPWGSATHAAIAVGSFSFIFLAVHQIFVGLFQKSLRMEFPALSEVVGRAVLLAAIGITALAHGGLIAIMASMGIANLAMVSLSVIFGRKVQPFSLKLERPVIAEIIRRSWPIALSIVFNLVYLRGDIIVMKIVGRPEAEIGWYGAAYKPLDVITVIPMIFMGLILPLFVEAWGRTDHERVRRIIQRATDAVSLLAFPTLAGGIALATPLMIFISGPEFSPSGPLLALLVVAAFMVFYGALFGHLIVGIGRQRLMTWVYAADAAASLLLYFLLVPKYGATAAAWVTIFSETVIAVAGGAIILAITKIRPKLDTVGKAIAASAMMGLAITALPNLHVLIRVCLGAALYVIIIFAIKGVRKEELREILRKG
jgi:O-antigen/teichoic acid export membrane protein